MSNHFASYLSPFTWRYGSEELRKVWSEQYKRKLWRRIWLTLAEVQHEYGFVNAEQISELRENVHNIDIPRALEIEAEIHHDLMAEIRTYAEQCPRGGGIIHLGLTSMDVVDNTDALRVRDSLDLLLPKLKALISSLCDQIEAYADLPIIAFTHLQPAEPSTLGYRLAQYAQDLWLDWQSISRLRANIKGKGFRGAVGTGAALVDLIGIEHMPAFDQGLSDRLGLNFFTVTTQVYPRKQDYDITSALAGLGASLYKFSFDIRLLQAPPIGEISEPFGKQQVGSSAMPFKRNPINAEKIDSLARLLANFPRTAWDNAAHTLLERTLDDSANRRSTLPEAFLVADEILMAALKIVDGMRVNEHAIRRNLDHYGPFAATERILMALSKAGADRQEMHERIREHSMHAWSQLGKGGPNPLIAAMIEDPVFQKYLSQSEIKQRMEHREHLGDAPERARLLRSQIMAVLKEGKI